MSHTNLFCPCKLPEFPSEMCSLVSPLLLVQALAGSTVAESGINASIKEGPVAAGFVTKSLQEYISSSTCRELRKPSFSSTPSSVLAICAFHLHTRHSSTPVILLFSFNQAHWLKSLLNAFTLSHLGALCYRCKAPSDITNFAQNSRSTASSLHLAFKSSTSECSEVTHFTEDPLSYSLPRLHSQL